MDQLVQLFFKHERAVFAKGQLSFEARPPFAVIVALALLAILFIYFLYIRPNARLTSPVTIGLILLRVTFILLLGVTLMRPVMVVPSVIPKSTAVAVIADDSGSMQLKDEKEQPRIERIKTLLASDSSFSKRLSDKFQINLYGFSTGVTSLREAGELQAQGAASDLAGALQDAVKRSISTPLSAIVMITDGAANTPTDLSAQLQNLRARGLPVYTVGVGSAVRFKDAELVRVTIPHRVLIGSNISAEAVVRLSGYEATKILIGVSEDGRAIKTQEFEVQTGETRSLSVEFTPATAGTHRYTFTVTPLEGEMTVDNNSQEALVQVTDNTAKVLYIEGEPRWEYGKLRAALTRNEKKVAVVSFLRSADNKFFRQGIENESELAGGFPKTEEELFAYQGLILGSVEANFFTFDQLKSIEAFVARRGGGLLALGGRYAFDAGKYATTPIGDLLPLTLNDQVELPPAPGISNFKAALTTRGRTHAITRLGEGPALTQKAWEQLPPISIPEVLSGVKPGATVLLEARSTENRNLAVPLLAEERYGRGRTLALTASDTWRWRMEMDSKDTSHETFWRQLLRYLVSTTPNQIEVESERDVYAVNEPVRIRGEVNDKKYEAIRDAAVTLRITKPSGLIVEMPLQFSVGSEASNYQGEFVPDEIGLHGVELRAAQAKASLGAAQANASLGTAESSFLVTEINREFYDAVQNVGLLKRIAAETGGKYYTVDQAEDLIDELTYREGTNSEPVTKELWDMPIIFLLLIGLVTAEWFLRKRENLA